MPATRSTPVGVKPAPADRPSLAACLAAAQADAERLYGDGPVPLWTPRIAWKGWAAGAGALLAVGLWWWWAPGGDAPVGTPAAVVATAPITSHDTLAAPEPPPAAVPAVAVAVEAAAAPASVEGPACDAAGCQGPPTLLPDLAEAAPSPAEPDAWALHPEPGRVVHPPRSEGSVNTPEIPDETDPTPGEETSPDEDLPEAPVVERD